MDVTSYLLGKKAGGGGDTPTGTIDITENGTYNVKSYASADVDVQPDLESKSVTISTNTTTTITPTQGKDGLSSVEVTTNVPQPSGSTTITTNGEHNVASYETANVQVPQPSGKITITQNGTDIDVSSYATADVSVTSSKVELLSGARIVFLGSTSNTQEIQNSVDYLNEKIDFSTLTSTQWMFQNCSNLTTLDLSNISLPNVTTMNAMFLGCSSLTELDISSFTSTTNTSSMFQSCTNINKIDMRNFDFTTISNHTNMFGSQASTYVPANCLIIVKDATQKQWLNTNFSRLTNVKTVAEYEGS